MAAETAPSALPAPVEMSLAQRVLELAIALAAAYDRRDIREQHLALSLLLASVQELPPSSRPIRVDPKSHIAQSLTGGAYYDLLRREDGVMLHLADATGHYAAVTMTTAQATQFRADFGAVVMHLLWGSR